MSAEVDLVRSYWAAAQERDWDAFRALVTEDVVHEAPQSRERVRGREVCGYQKQGAGYGYTRQCGYHPMGRRGNFWCLLCRGGNYVLQPCAASSMSMRLI